MLSQNKIKKQDPHRAFLEALPNEKFKSIVLKIFVLGIIGFVLSFVSIVIALSLNQGGFQKETNTGYFIGLFSQNLPFLILTVLLFFRKNIKNSFSQLFPKFANKSVLIILGILLLELFLGILLNTINFTLYKTPDSWSWLEEYIKHGSESITFSYLQTLLGSFFIFLFIAFSEEFVFRFTIYRFLRRKGLLLALLLSSILFLVIHGQLNFGILLSGIMIALYYEYTNFFVGAVVIHTLSNLLVVYYSYYLTYLILR